MQANEARISELANNLGRQVDDEYIEFDDCKINLEELAYSIWTEDNIQKPITKQIFDLRTFETHFCPLLLSESPDLSFIALKALASCTYPYPANANDIEILNNIYQHYKRVLTFKKDVLLTALEFVHSIIIDPHASQEDFQKAEVGFTFIRNVLVIPSPSDVSESLFHILNEGGLYEIIEVLKIKSFGSRIKKFAQILAGILYGSFVPFLPLTTTEEEPKQEVVPNSPKKPSPLDALASQLKSQKLNKPSRHGHWGGSLLVKSSTKGFVYNGPITSEVIDKGVDPTSIIKPHSRRNIIESREIPPQFTPEVQEAARRLIGTDSFKYVFSRVLPRSFSAYDATISITEQIQMVDLTRFYLEFILKYGGQFSVRPLVSEENIKYFLTMANFYMDARVANLDATPLNKALNKVCLLFGYAAKFLVDVIMKSLDGEEIKAAKSIVTESATDIEDFLITVLSKKLKSNSPVYMLQDAIISLERLLQLYKVAETEKMVRKRTYGDSTSTADEFDEIFVDYEAFDAEAIIKRLTRRTNVLDPYFTCIENWRKCNQEELGSIAKMLKRFVFKRSGLSHLFKLTYFIIINKVLTDKDFQKSEEPEIIELREVMHSIINKFLYNVKRQKSTLLLILVGPDSDELFDEVDDMALDDDEMFDALGVSQEVRDIMRDVPSQPKRRKLRKVHESGYSSEAEDDKQNLNDEDDDDDKDLESSNDEADVRTSMETLKREILESKAQNSQSSQSSQVLRKLTSQKADSEDSDDDHLSDEDTKLSDELE